MPELLEKARAALQDADAQTRVAGLQLVQAQSLAAALPDVAARLRADDDVAVRYQAARTLAQFAGPAALPPLLDGLRDEDMYVRVQVTAALIRVGAPAVSGLTEALTVGALELRLRRLGLLTQAADQRERLAGLAAQRDAVRAEWPLHYRRKLLWEANSRLDTLQRYLGDMAGNPTQAARNWQPELLRRSIVEELRRVMAQLDLVDAALDAKVRASDGLLTLIADEPCAFQWDAQLQPVYSAPDFPWLYHRPRLHK